MKFKKGFTVIEVLVVIGIIVILTAIIYPAVNGIRAKGRDNEKISDFSTLQIGLGVYYSQHTVEGYPKYNADGTGGLELLAPNYAPHDAVVSPNVDPYIYIPLTRDTTSPNPKCTSYHLGVKLEAPNAQIDSTDTFTSLDLQRISNGFSYCGPIPAKLNNKGIAPRNGPDEYYYNVHPQ
jgi:prepilin-type N-terminal cleavage/methylation domain-containing protein